MLFDSITRRPPRSTLSPYTTLFRSADRPRRQHAAAAAAVDVHAVLVDDPLCDDGIDTGHQVIEVLARICVLDGVADRKSTRLNSSHSQISYAVFCLKKKIKPTPRPC